MARTKLSVADRIIADVLTLPPLEAKLLVNYLAVTLRLVTPSGKPLAVTTKGRTSVAPPTTAPAPLDVSGFADAAVPIASAPRAVRRPRLPRQPPAAVPVGEPGPVMEVGDQDFDGNSQA